MRLRLTLWAVLATTVLVLVGGGLTYLLLGEQLVQHREEDVLAELDQFEQAASGVTSAEGLLDFTRTYLQGPESNSLHLRGVVLVLLLHDGRVLSNADFELETLPIARPLLERGEPVFGREDTPDGPYVVAGRPIMLDGTGVGGVVAASPLRPVADLQRQVAAVLALAAVVAIAAMGVGYWLLIGKALEPVRRMSRAATAISRQDLSRRIEYRGPRDEVGELAATLNDMLSRLEEAIRSQDRFISDVSHELRTPLTIVKGHLQVLDREADPDPERMREEHRVVLDELDRLNRLVEGLLTLARLEGSDVLETFPVDLDGLLSTLVRQGVHLGDRRWEVDRLPGVIATVDQDRLTQALLNLMANAVRHTAPGDVVALGGELRGAHVALWVRDTGAGMSPEVQSRAFDRFYHGVERAQSDEDGSGLGLGLAIVKGIAQAHGGHVDVESTLGEGSRFTLVLPARTPGPPASV